MKSLPDSPIEKYNDSVPGTRKRVAVAMSGGVDSSVAAGLLVEQGFDVIGMMMRLWSEPGGADQTPHNRCCTPEQMADARRVADKLQIPFYVLDVQEYITTVVLQTHALNVIELFGLIIY